MSRLRPHLPAILGALAGVAVLAWLGLIEFAWTDYDNEAAPAFKALVEGRIADFLALAPAYGGSLVLRAPFAALPAAWGGGELAVFRAGSLVCTLAAAGLGVWLVARMRERGHTMLARGAALGLVAAGPIAEQALEYGHPEEILGGVLCVAAVLAAARRHGVWAAVLLGLAVATKAWALLAVGPVLLALGTRPLRTLAVAALVTGSLVHPWQAWWFLGERAPAGPSGADKRLAPAWLETVTHPLIILGGFGLSALLWLARRRRRVSGLDALLLLALLLHLRCVLDTWNVVYYAVPFLLALVAWEGLARTRPPVLSLLATMAVWALFKELPAHGIGRDSLALAYLAFALPAAAAIALRLFAPFLWTTSVQMRAPGLSPPGAAADQSPA